MISYDLFFVKLNENAILPNCDKGNVGFDLRTIDEGIIEPGSTMKLRTGLALAKSPEKIGFTFDVFAKIEQRSGLASKGIFPVGGIVDPSYRGEICVLLHNSSTKAYEVEKGDKVAQLVFYPVLADFVSTQFTEHQDSTDRGSNGFGSSGR